MPFAAGSCQLCARAPCQASPGRAVSAAPPGTNVPNTDTDKGSWQEAPRLPTPLLGEIQRPQPDGAAAPRSSLVARLGWAGSSCCLTQRDASSGLNVTSRRRLAGAGRRAGERGRSPGSEGAGRLGTGFPLPLSPSVAVAASAAVRTDEGSEKQSFSAPADGEQTASSAVIPCPGSTCGRPPPARHCHGWPAVRGGLWRSGTAGGVRALLPAPTGRGWAGLS